MCSPRRRIRARSVVKANSAESGKIQFGTLRQSNVDLGTELAAMIEDQSGYSAGSRVFQAGAELLDVLVNLKR